MEKLQLICFEHEGKSYAVSAAELAGVASACPFVTYPGLPVGVFGISQWSGRIFPVINPFDVSEAQAAAGTFLFSNERSDWPFSEVAVLLPSRVRATFVESLPEGVTLVALDDIVRASCDVKAKHAA